MGTYRYEAARKSGELVTGRMEAEGQIAVIRRLRDMDLTPVQVGELRPSFLSQSITLPARVKLGDLSLFSRQLAAMLNAGIPLTRALDTLSRQSANVTLSRALGEVARSVESGTSFSDSLQAYPNIFSLLYVNMVRAGEAGGTLEATLNRLSNQLQKDKELRDNIRSASFYPVGVLIFASLILVAMLLFLVPVFVNLFPPNADLPLPTMFLIALSDALRRFWYLFFFLVIILVLALRALALSPGGARFLDRLKFRLPVFGPLIQKSVVAAFARTFSTMMATGIPVVQALEASGNSTGHSLVMAATKRAGQQVQEGSSVHLPLEESGIFPPMVTHMVAVGEDTGEMPEMMDKVAAFFEEEVATMTKGLTALIEPLMLVIIGVLVGGILLALYMPIFTVITQVQ